MRQCGTILWNGKSEKENNNEKRISAESPSMPWREAVHEIKNVKTHQNRIVAFH